MRWILLIGVSILVAGCENTVNGLGRDMQSAGESLSQHTSPTPPPPPPLPPMPPRRYDQTEDGAYGYQPDRAAANPRPYPPEAPVYHDPNQPYYLNRH